MSDKMVDVTIVTIKGSCVLLCAIAFGTTSGCNRSYSATERDSACLVEVIERYPDRPMEAPLFVALDPTAFRVGAHVMFTTKFDGDHLESTPAKAMEVHIPDIETRYTVLELFPDGTMFIEMTWTASSNKPNDDRFMAMSELLMPLLGLHVNPNVSENTLKTMGLLDRDADNDEGITPGAELGKQVTQTWFPAQVLHAWKIGHVDDAPAPIGIQSEADAKRKIALSPKNLPAITFNAGTPIAPARIRNWYSVIEVLRGKTTR